VGTLAHTTHNGEVQAQTKGVSYSTTISFNQQDVRAVDVVIRPLMKIAGASVLYDPLEEASS